MSNRNSTEILRKSFILEETDCNFWSRFIANSKIDCWITEGTVGIVRLYSNCHGIIPGQRIQGLEHNCNVLRCAWFYRSGIRNTWNSYFSRNIIFRSGGIFQCVCHDYCTIGCRNPKSWIYIGWRWIEVKIYSIVSFEIFRGNQWRTITPRGN